MRTTQARSRSESPDLRQASTEPAVTSDTYMPKNYEIGPTEKMKEEERYDEESKSNNSEKEDERKEDEERTKEEDASDDDTSLYDLPNDAYAFIFLAPVGTQSFLFGFYVFALKMIVFTLLAIDAFDAWSETKYNESSKVVLATQCLILPVAVAMQEDLRSFFTLLSNVKYKTAILEFHPHATKFKYYLGNTLRGLDGMYSLCINFIVLLLADSVLTLFLNFAALEFLQMIDNMAFKYAQEGFLTPELEAWAHKVAEMRMPKRAGTDIVTNLDSVFFISTLENFLVAWYMLKIY